MSGSFKVIQRTPPRVTIRDASNATGDGDALTAAAIPSQSVTGTNGSFYYDGTRWWYRQNLPSGIAGQFRLAIPNGPTQLFRGRLEVPTTLTQPRVILGPRYSAGYTSRIVLTAARQVAVQIGVSPFTVLGTTAIPGGIPAGSEPDIQVESRSADGTAKVTVYAQDSATKLAELYVTGLTPQATMTHYDVGSNDNIAQAVDLRWTNLQFAVGTGDLEFYDGAKVEPAAPAIPTGNFDVVVGFIQSNMRGRADDFDPATDTYRPGVYHWNPTTNAVVRIDTEPAGTLATFEQVPYMGPLNTWSRAYVDGGQLAAGRSLLVVNLAEGGTGVTLPDSNGGNETWWPSETAAKTDLYARAIAELQTLWAAIGAGSKVVAVLANHGSTDGTNNTPADVFTSRATEVIQSVQAFVYSAGMTTDQAAPYVMMQMRPSLIAGETRHAIIDQAQQVMARTLPGVRYAYSPVGTEYERPDSVHFNAAGVREIGTRLYAAWLTAASTGQLTGSGQVTGAPKPAVALQGTVSGSGAVTGAGVPFQVSSGAGSTSGTGTVTATGAPRAAAPGSTSGSGVVTASSVPSTQGTGATSGSGLVTATGRPSLARPGALSGSGVVTAASSASPAATGSVAGSGDVAGVGVGTEAAGATGSSAGTGVVAGAGTPRVAVQGVMSGAGTVTAGGAFRAAAAAALSGAGAVSAVGTPSTSSAGALTGAGAVVAAGIGGSTSQASVSGSGVVTAAAQSNLAAAGGVSGVGSVVGVAVPRLFAGGNVAGSGLAVGVGASGSSTAGALTGTGLAAGVGVAATGSSAAQAGSGLVVGSGGGAGQANGSTSGVGAVVGAATARIVRAGALAGSGSAIGSPSVSVAAAAQVAGAGLVTGAGVATSAAGGAGVLAGTGAATGAALVTAGAQGGLTGAGVVAGSGGTVGNGAGSLSGTGTVVSLGVARPAFTTGTSGPGSVVGAGAARPARTGAQSGSGVVAGVVTSSFARGAGTLSGVGIILAAVLVRLSRGAELEGAGVVTGHGRDSTVYSTPPPWDPGVPDFGSVAPWVAQF